MELADIESVRSLGLGKKEFSTENASFWEEEQLAKWCQSPDDILLVAESEEKVIGFSLYAGHRPTSKVTWENLYVMPEARGAGVASKLIEEGLRQVKVLGYGYIMLCINAEDQGSMLSLVEKFGFKKWTTVIWADKLIKD